MKKRRLVAWGLALTMGLLAGCSGQTDVVCHQCIDAFLELSSSLSEALDTYPTGTEQGDVYLYGMFWIDYVGVYLADVRNQWFMF